MKNAMINLRSWMMLMAMLVVASTTAMAAVPSAPQDLNQPDEGKDFPRGVIMQWEMPDNSPEYDGFKFYLAEGHTSDMSSFELHDSLEIFQDSVPMGNMGQYFHFIHGLDKGDYTVYVTAYNNDGESAASNLLEFEVKGSKWEDRIYFTSEMPTDWSIAKNTSWTYDADAESESDFTIKYDLDEEPTGMTIDETTGVINWTPTESGTFEFMIIAYEDGNDDNEARMWMSLYVTECEVAPVVSGTVVDKATGDEINRGEVTLLEYFNSDTLMPNAKYFHGAIENGEFSIEADAGQYYILVHAPGYKTYPEMVEDVNPITLTCGAEVVFNVELEKNNWNRERISFTTVPSYDDLMLSLNQEWSFDFDAEADVDDIDLRFSIDGPAGMTVDSLTGVVTWTPEEAGESYFMIIAEDANGNAQRAVAQFNVYVSSCESPISLTGTVVFDNPDGATELEPVDGGYAVLMQIETRDSAGVPMPGKYHNAVPLEDGTFEFNVDAGQYLLFFHGEGTFIDEMWEDAYNVDDATILDLECGNDYTVNASVEEYKLYTIEGQVTDEETGEGIPYALIQVIGTTQNQNYRQYTIVAADEDGEYKIELDSKFDFVLRASTDAIRYGGGKDSVTHNYYIPEYYDNVTDITEATVITLTDDLEDIDFQLAKAADYDNSLAGSVVDGDGAVVAPAWVVAFLIDTDANNQDHINWGFTTQANDNGVFEYEGLIPGKYVMLAFPEDFELAPGYFVENDFATLNWDEATRIEITATSEIDGKVIKLQDMTDVIGSGIISGKISKKGKNGGMIKGEGEPVSGALVYTLNEAGEIVEFKRTSNMGIFQVDNLPIGRYNVVVDKVGFDKISMWADITDEQKEVEMETLTLNEAPTSVEDKVFAEVNLYPNPAVTHLTVNLGALAKDANIRLVDAAGATLYKGIIKSNENHKIDVDGMSSGMYYLKVSIDEEVTVLPVAITK